MSCRTLFVCPGTRHCQPDTVSPTLVRGTFRGCVHLDEFCRLELVAEYYASECSPAEKAANAPAQTLHRPPNRREAPFRVRRGYGALHNNIAIGSSRKLRKTLRKGASLRSITGTSLRDFLRTRDFKRIAEDVALTYDVGLRG